MRHGAAKASGNGRVLSVWAWSDLDPLSRKVFLVLIYYWIFLAQALYCYKHLKSEKDWVHFLAHPVYLGKMLGPYNRMADIPDLEMSKEFFAPYFSIHREHISRSTVWVPHPTSRMLRTPKLNHGMCYLKVLLFMDKIKAVKADLNLSMACWSIVPLLL